MKIIALTAAGLIAASAITPTPAEAQRYGNGYRHGRGWNGDPGRGWNRGWDRNRGRRQWNGGWRGGPRGYYGRPRVTCRWVRGFYGPEQRCFTRYR